MEKSLIEMNVNHLVGVALILIAAILAFHILFKIIGLINSRPDLVAFTGLACVVAGGFYMLADSNPAQGLMIVLAGALLLLLAAVIRFSNNSSEVKQ